jgi:mannonate dehydratase
MNRRQFVSSTAAAVIAGSQILQASDHANAPAKPGQLKLGCQSAPSNARHFQYFARYGVRNICGYPEVSGDRLYATQEELTRLRELAEAHGLHLDCVAPPFLPSSHIDREKHGAIMLAESPERDRDIESFQTMIRNCAATGVPMIKYNMSLLGVLRTGRAPGRGDATYSQWRLRDAHPDSPLTRAGRMNADDAWERITYFLERVVPVANEYKVRLACHPHDPGVPPEGYQGISRVLGTVDGLKKFVQIMPSPYHGLNFCQGTISEMLAEPGKQIYDVIRHFGSQGKIFNVHFRNIRGSRNDFVETFPDDGDVDLVRALRVYKEVGYSGMLMPDHVPQAPDDPDGLQSFAFCYGYIRALIQSAGG